jgi:hypothetical protein
MFQMHDIHVQKLQTYELIDNKIKVVNPMHDDSCNQRIDMMQLELRMQKSSNLRKRLLKLRM